MDRDAKIFVAGHRGLVGSAIVRRLEAGGYRNLVLKTHHELDLTDQAHTFAFFQQVRPSHVFLAAAKVGGIMANATYPADFIYVNLQIAANIVHACHRYDVTKLLNLGSSCIYPRLAPQPLKEEYLLTGPLEQTNRAYAVAKIAAIELCDSYRQQHGRDFVSAMPTNLYGPGDNYDPMGSHVIPGLIHKFVAAKRSSAPTVTLWGTGAPLREFLYVDDLADACLFLMKEVSRPGPINVGSGQEVSIRELAEIVRDVVGFAGTIEWDHEKPDGTPRKLLDTTLLGDLGWRSTTPLREGIQRAVADYLAR